MIIGVCLAHVLMLVDVQFASIIASKLYVAEGNVACEELWTSELHRSEANLGHFSRLHISVINIKRV